MQNLIFCKINMFDAQQTVIKVGPDGQTIIAQTDIANLGHTIASACEVNNIFNVRLGGSRQHTEEIADDIRVTYALMYHKSQEINIEIETE